MKFLSALFLCQWFGFSCSYSIVVSAWEHDTIHHFKGWHSSDIIFEKILLATYVWWSVLLCNILTIVTDAGCGSLPVAKQITTAGTKSPLPSLDRGILDIYLRSRRVTRKSYWHICHQDSLWKLKSGYGSLFFSKVDWWDQLRQKTFFSQRVRPL